MGRSFVDMLYNTVVYRARLRRVPTELEECRRCAPERSAQPLEHALSAAALTQVGGAAFRPSAAGAGFSAGRALAAGFGAGCCVAGTFSAGGAVVAMGLAPAGFSVVGLVAAGLGAAPGCTAGAMRPHPAPFGKPARAGLVKGARSP